MEISEFTIKIMMLFLPGIIAFTIIDNLTIHKKTEFHHRIIYSFLLAIVSYLPWTILLEVVKYVYGFELPSNFIVNILNAKSDINFYEVSVSSVMSIIIALLICKLINGGLLFYLFRFMNISGRSGIADIWVDFVQRAPNSMWVMVRDIASNRIYKGVIHSISDGTEKSGIILSTVTVYRETDAVELYKTKLLYIPRDIENLIIDIV